MSNPRKIVRIEYTLKILRRGDILQNLTDSEFELFRSHIKKRYGISLSNEKKSLIYSRLRTVIEKKGMSSFKEYYEYILKDRDGADTKEFIDKITTNHTFFMREKEHFEYLFDYVFPEIEKRHSGSKDIRLWCAACSSGEEAYTLQILLQEYFGKKQGWNTEMLATDISNTVLNKAHRGIYTKTSLEEMPPAWIDKYFDKYDENHMVAKDVLKKNITFGRMNFIEDKFNFKKPFQVIFCRNVMIYFEQQTKNDLVHRFFDASEKGAHLFIGQSESLGADSTEYKYVMPAVYKKV